MSRIMKYINIAEGSRRANAVPQRAATHLDGHRLRGVLWHGGPASLSTLNFAFVHE